MKASVELFLAAIVFGMGFRIGWAVIAFIVSMAARALGSEATF